MSNHGPQSANPDAWGGTCQNMGKKEIVVGEQLLNLYKRMSIVYRQKLKDATN